MGGIGHGGLLLRKESFGVDHVGAGAQGLGRLHAGGGELGAAGGEHRVLAQVGQQGGQHGIDAAVQEAVSLLARERLGSTALGKGVAMPHGRIKGLKESVIAIISVDTPVAFDAPDGQAVSLMVFLLVPEHATQQHLEILSELAELLSDKTNRDILLNAQYAGEVLQFVQTWSPARRSMG